MSWTEHNRNFKNQFDNYLLHKGVWKNHNINALVTGFQWKLKWDTFKYETWDFVSKICKNQQNFRVIHLNLANI